MSSESMSLRKYTADDLRAIRDDYRARLKANKWA